MAEFTVALDSFIKRAKAAPGLVVRKVSLDLLTSIVLRTPVDTGRARASWNVSLNRPDPTVSITLTDKDGRKTIHRGQAALSQWKADDDVCITSGLPYIPMLEFGGWNGPTAKVTENGYSRQAPAGMVRVSMVEVQDYIRAAVRALPKD